MKSSIKILGLLMLCLMTAGMLVLGGCSNFFGGGGDGDGEEGMGSFTVRFGGSASARAINYPPASNADWEQLEFIVQFKRADGTVAKTIESESTPVANGSIAVGTYTVSVDVKVKADKSLFASGSTSDVKINPGHNDTIRVTVQSAIHVSISPPTATVSIGKTQQFTATVSGDPSNNVTWTVSGNAQTGTSISSSGLLTVDAGELNDTTLTVTATSVADNKKSAEALVNVDAREHAEAPSLFIPDTDTTYKYVVGAASTTALTVTVENNSAISSQSGSLSYEWFSNGTNSNSGGTAVGVANGGQTAVYTPPATTVGTVYYYCVVSNTIGDNLDGGNKSTSTPSKQIAVTVIKPVSGITAGMALAETVGTPLTLSATVVPTDATNQTIVWSVQNAGSTGANITGSNTLNTTAGGTVTIRATITNGGGTNVVEDYTQDFSITINKKAGAEVTKPVVNSTTGDSITVNAVTLEDDTGQSIEYNISEEDDGTGLSSWQSGRTFTGLAANRTYFVYARSAENPAYNAGTTANISAAIKTLGQRKFDIGFEEIANDNLELPWNYSGTPLIITLNTGTAVTLTLNNFGQYSSVAWFVDGIHKAATASYTLDPLNFSRLDVGTHSLRVEVVKGGVPYNRTIPFEVTN